jgi:hypothetical protein
MTVIGSKGGLMATEEMTVIWSRGELMTTELIQVGRWIINTLGRVKKLQGIS